MKTLHISVSDKKATYRERDGEIVCGNSDYVIKFSFDAEWDAYNAKTARFAFNGRHIDVPFTGDSVNVPVLNNTTSVNVGVYVGEMATTAATIACQKSVLCTS